MGRNGVGRLIRNADPNDPNALRIVNRGIPGGREKAERKAEERERAKPEKRLGEGALTKKRKSELMEQAQRMYWMALPGLMEALIEGAKEGRVAPLKLLFELGGLERGVMARDLAVGEAKDWNALFLAEIRRGRDEAATEEVRRREQRAYNLAELDKEEQRAAAEDGGLDGV